MTLKCALLPAFAFGACSLARSELLFYGGEWDPVNGNAFPHSAPEQFQTARIYDDFHLPSISHIDAVFGEHFIAQGFVPTRAQYEIRTGMSNGSPGTLVAVNEDVPCEVIATGRFSPVSNTPEYRVRIPQLDVLLDPGTYWLMVRPYHPGLEVALGETIGANGVGSPINNGNSFWVYGFGGGNYTSVGGFDAPYGVEGYVVPEPVSLTPLALGFLMATRRRDRRPGSPAQEG